MYCIFNIKIQKYYSLFHVICISTEMNYYQSSGCKGFLKGVVGNNKE